MYPLSSRLQWLAPERDAVAPFTSSGVYQLFLRLPETATLQIGRLGKFDFPAGLYVYTGSAMGGIGARVARHLRTEKKKHWHIDYLLAQATIEAIAVLSTKERMECLLHTALMQELEGKVVAARFGSSDCRCPSHLGYLGEPNRLLIPLLGKEDRNRP